MPCGRLIRCQEGRVSTLPWSALGFDAPLAVVSVELDGWVEVMLAFDIERDRAWSWATLASEIRSAFDAAAQSVQKRPRAIDMNYTVDYPIDYRPHDGKDQAFCVSIGDSWGPSSISSTEAMSAALWSAAESLSRRRVALARLPERVAILALSEQNLVDGFVEPDQLAENARSLFLPYLEALSLQAHVPEAGASRSPPSL